jgi:hypothetical protein
MMSFHHHDLDPLLGAEMTSEDENTIQVYNNVFNTSAPH